MTHRTLRHFSGLASVVIVAACGGATDTGSNRGIPDTDAGTGGSSTGGRPSSGGVAGGGKSGSASGGALASGGSSGSGGGGVGGSTGGVSGDGGPCDLCLPNYDLHWGQDGGLVAYVETSRLGPCASYSHERTPTLTDPPSLLCTAPISRCPGSPLDGIITAMAAPEFTAALQNHTLYGSDPRPVDGQVFRIGIGNDFVDIGPNCEADPASCPTMPKAVADLMKLLRDLDAAMLAVDPCKTTFGR